MIKRISIKVEYDNGSKSVYEGNVNAFNKSFIKKLSDLLTKVLKEVNNLNK